MKRHHIEYLWAWFDALRRNDTEAMSASLAPTVVWQGIQAGLVCHGPDQVVEGFVSGYDASQEIDSVELLGSETHVVLGVRAPDLGEVEGIEIGSELYNVFTIEDDKITRIQDYLDREQALAAAAIVD